MAFISPCPVCGRLPKVKHRDRLGQHLVLIECRPWVSKFHEQALAYGSYSSEAYKEAIHIWNGRVKHYQEARKDVST